MGNFIKKSSVWERISGRESNAQIKGWVGILNQKHNNLETNAIVGCNKKTNFDPQNMVCAPRSVD